MKRNKKRTWVKDYFKEELVDWDRSISFSKISARKTFQGSVISYMLDLFKIFILLHNPCNQPEIILANALRAGVL